MKTRASSNGGARISTALQNSALYDEVSFDAGYASELMATFEPMVRRVLYKD